MREKRVLIPIHREEIHPRFDRAGEILIAAFSGDGQPLERKILLLAQPSADEICDHVLRERITHVICGAIEEEYYHYLRWKRIDVLDFVAGPWEEALARFMRGEAKSGDVLFARKDVHE
jgi:predicted Fe-Mo cluster-binding NifX family protein